MTTRGNLYMTVPDWIQTQDIETTPRQVKKRGVDISRFTEWRQRVSGCSMTHLASIEVAVNSMASYRKCCGISWF